MNDDQKSAAERPSKDNASPAIQVDKPKRAESPRRPRGKMYWKFATLEGWRAPTNNQAIPREDECD